MVRRSRNLCLILCSGTSIGWQSISASRRSEDAIHWRSFDIEIFCVYPHAYAWRLSVDTEPPCVSMRVDANISANRIAGTAYYTALWGRLASCAPVANLPTSKQHTELGF